MDHKGPAFGIVLDSTTEVGKGAVATILVQKGTLKKGDMILVGEQTKRVRSLVDENGKTLSEAGPSVPASITGLDVPPKAGEEFVVVTSEKMAKEISNERAEKAREERLAGYQPFIINHLVSKNLNAKTFYYDKMKNLSVQLAYKLGGFTDKDNIKILTDSVSPGSTSGSKFIPDENYKILFRTSNPVESFYYSGVLIEKNTDVSTDGSTILGGYKVLGYSTTKPYFNFNYPMKTTTANPVSVAGSTVVKRYTSYQETTQTIPYGYVFEIGRASCRERV